ncbi:MAG: amidohydrolase family protein [Verrucomicrobiota bacterium]|nr:amidohydrolase family protein [Verrucomicrobiota bacterium]
MRQLLLRARVLLPVARAPIPDGALLIEGKQIAAVGRWADLRDFNAPLLDLGDSILLPGLVNAHCHLDYTAMAGKLPPPRQFPDWIASILAYKAHWTYTDYAQSWISGAKMLLRNGVTSVADIEAVPELLPDVWECTPLRVHSLFEMTGVKSQVDPALILEETLARMDTLPQTRNKQAGLSPHAPYSTAPELFRIASQAARQRNLLCSTHLAESQPEFEMYRQAGGPLYQWLKPQRKMDDCDGRSPLRHLHQLGALHPSMIAVHVNYLAEGDLPLLAASGASVAHCPRSHTYFNHAPFPYEKLRDAGVNVCLGTDSLASVLRRGGLEPELNLFEEMREFALKNPHVSPDEILRLATLNGAIALRQKGILGQLTPGAAADCIALSTPPVANPAEAILFPEAALQFSMIDGEILLRPENLS